MAGEPSALNNGSPVNDAPGGPIHAKKDLNGGYPIVFSGLSENHKHSHMAGRC